MRVCVMLVLASLLAAPAMAQDVPEAPAAAPAAMEEETSSSQDAAGSSAPAGDENWELCPEPTTAITEVPNQLDQLQADIDRYTLCLNRAELLMKLEDLKNQNKEKAEAGMTAPGMNLPVTPQPLSDADTNQLMQADSQMQASSGDGAMPSMPEAPVPQEGYTVKEIRGVNGVLVARVVTPSGEIEQVKEGDTLEGGARVTSVTASQVMISKDGKPQRLSWAN